MRKLALCLLFTFLLVAPLSQASVQEVTYDLRDDGAYVTHTTLTNDSSLNLWIEEDAYNIDVRVGGELSGFNLDRRNGFKLLYPEPNTTGKEVEVNYRSSQVMEKGDSSYFVTTLRTDRSIESVETELILPERALLKEGGGSMISPEPSSIDTDGRRMSIKWNLESLNEDDEIAFFVAYEEPGNLFLIVSITSLSIVILSLVLFIYRRKGYRRKESRERFQHLVERERKVVDALMTSGDETMWQKELQRATDFTKSKLSRTLKKMEERNIVEKIPHGTSNKVKLVEEEDQ